MKTKAEILRILQKEKPELMRRYGLKRLALFGSYAREDQREDSDVDIMVEIDPHSGRFLITRSSSSGISGGESSPVFLYKDPEFLNEYKPAN